MVTGTFGGALRVLLDASEGTQLQAGTEFGYIFGISLACAAALFNNVGLQLQKLAHTKIEQAEAKGITGGSYLKSKMWFAGMVGVVTASIFDFLALGYAPQSVIAPMGSLTMALNIITVPLFQHEYPSWRDVLGIGITVGGTILCVAFSSHAEEAYTLDSLFQLYRAMQFWIYGFLVTIYIMGAWYFCRWASRLSRSVGVNSKRYQELMPKHRFFYGSMAGVMGAQSVLFAKTTSTSFLIMFNGQGLMFKYYQTYLVIIGVGVTVFFQVRWLNSGLKKFSAMVVVPIFQTFWIIISVVGGLVCYDELQYMGQDEKLLFSVGASIVIIGVYILSSGKTKEKVLQDEVNTLKNVPGSRQRIDTVTTMGAHDSETPLEIPRRRKKLTLAGPEDDDTSEPGASMQTLAVPMSGSYQWGDQGDPQRSRSVGAQPSELPPPNETPAAWEQSFWAWSDFLDGITIGGTAMGRLTNCHTFKHYDDNFNFQGHPGKPGTIPENERSALLDSRRKSAPLNSLAKKPASTHSDSILCNEEREVNAAQPDKKRRAAFLSPREVRRAQEERRNYYTPPRPTSIESRQSAVSAQTAPERRIKPPKRPKSTPPVL